MTAPADAPWVAPGFVARSQALLDSYTRRLGQELVSRAGSTLEQSELLFRAPFVVVAHGTEDDPILNYANQLAIDLWETDLETLLQTPSRLTAEPLHRDERARMLQRTREQGYIDDYQGIRITTTGRRFLIRKAIVWNVDDGCGVALGQAATFAAWEWL